MRGPRSRWRDRRDPAAGLPVCDSVGTPALRSRYYAQLRKHSRCTSDGLPGPRDKSALRRQSRFALDTAVHRHSAPDCGIERTPWSTCGAPFIQCVGQGRQRKHRRNRGATEYHAIKWYATKQRSDKIARDSIWHSDKTAQLKTAKKEKELAPNNAATKV